MLSVDKTISFLTGDTILGTARISPLAMTATGWPTCPTVNENSFRDPSFVNVMSVRSTEALSVIPLTDAISALEMSFPECNTSKSVCGWFCRVTAFARFFAPSDTLLRIGTHSAIISSLSVTRRPAVRFAVSSIFASEFIVAMLRMAIASLGAISDDCRSHPHNVENSNIAANRNKGNFNGKP